jgi:type II secretory pathway pseudopilin PulG
MINFKIQNNKGLARHNVRNPLGGFTLVETMFAVMILTFSIVGMMTVVASSLFSSRYARNEITANYLLQEVVDYIRNDRDTSVFLQNGRTIDNAWDVFIAKYDNCSDVDRGCYFNVLDDTLPTMCPLSETNCIDLYYDENASNSAFYVNDDGIGNSGKTKTGFQRKIVFVQNGDEIDVTVTVSWLNGGLTKSRSLSTTLMKWQI